MSKRDLSKFQIFLRKRISSLIPVAKYRRSLRRRWLHQRGVPFNATDASEEREKEDGSGVDRGYCLEDALQVLLPPASKTECGNEGDGKIHLDVLPYSGRDPQTIQLDVEALLLGRQGAGCVLMIDLNFKGGGAHAYRNKTLKQMHDEGKRVLVLEFEPLKKDRWQLTPAYLPGGRSIPVSMLESVGHLFPLLEIKEIFINNLAFCLNWNEALLCLRKWTRSFDVEMTYVFHDYLSVCSSFLLLDSGNRYCGGGNHGKCLQCMQENDRFIVPPDEPGVWRKKWGEMFGVVSRFICFSGATRDIITSIFPIEDRLDVIEHELLAPFEEQYVPPPEGAPLVLAFIGNFSREKGIEYLYDLSRLLEKKDELARIVVFAPLAPDVEKRNNMIFHGSYERRQLPSLLNEYGVRAVVFPSPCPETFSYVTQECMELNVPFVCFDIGAPAERVRKYGYRNSVIAKDFSAKGLYEGVKSLISMR